MSKLSNAIILQQINSKYDVLYFLVKSCSMLSLCFYMYCCYHSIVNKDYHNLSGVINDDDDDNVKIS